MPGVYLGKIDNIPFGMAMNKGLTFRMGQTHVQRYLPLLLEKILEGEIDPSKIMVTHRIKLKTQQMRTPPLKKSMMDALK